MKVISKNVITTLKSATVEFNQEELEFLKDVLNMIGGDPVNTRRRIATQIRTTLTNAGMNMEPTGDMTDREGSLYFLSTEDVENRKKTKKAKKVVWDSRNDFEDECPF